MALMDFTKGRVASGSHVLSGVSTTRQRQSTLRKPMLEFLNTLFLLAGFAICILVLMFALVLVHGALH
jgi:hypothetical protein